MLLIYHLKCIFATEPVKFYKKKSQNSHIERSISHVLKKTELLKVSGVQAAKNRLSSLHLMLEMTHKYGGVG